MTSKRYKTVLIQIRAPSGMNAKNIVKEKNNQMSTKINKIAPSFSIIYFFKQCVK